MLLKRDLPIGATSVRFDHAENRLFAFVLWLGAISQVPTQVEKLAEPRDGSECRNVARLHIGEVPQVHRRDSDNLEPLADGNDRRICAAEPAIDACPAG